MSGFAQLPHAMRDFPWLHDPNTVSLYTHLLLAADYKPKIWGNETLEPGQVIYGRKEWSRRTGISEQSLRTALDRLKSTNVVTIRPGSKYSVVTICSWPKYEAANQPDNQLPTSNQPATNQQSTTPIEVKKERSKEEYIPPTPLPNWVPVDPWKAFEQMRRKMKAP